MKEHKMAITPRPRDVFELQVRGPIFYQAGLCQLADMVSKNQFHRLELLLHETADANNNDYWHTFHTKPEKPHHTQLISRLGRMPISDEAKKEFFITLTSLHTVILGSNDLRRGLLNPPDLSWETVANTAVQGIYKGYNPHQLQLSSFDEDPRDFTLRSAPALAWAPSKAG